MSHIVSIRTQVRDAEAARIACRRLSLPQPVFGKTQLFSGEAEGLLVSLPGWRYPVAFDTSKGEALFDNFEGRWGERSQLDRFLQAYAVERAKIEARKKGYAVSERLLQDGSIRLQITAG